MPATGIGRVNRALAHVAVTGAEISTLQSWGSPADLNALRAGHLDALVLVGPVPVADLQVEPFGTKDRHLVVSADHPLAQGASVRLEDLLELPTFRRPDAVLPEWRSYWLNMDARGGEPRFIGRSTTEFDALLAIGTGRVVGVAPEGWGRVPGLLTRPVPDLSPVQLVLVTRPEQPSRSLHRFVGALRRRPPVLSPAERRVALLVAEGYSDPDIATRLSLSPRTVESHVANARRRLGLRSRAHLAAHLVTHPED